MQSLHSDLLKLITNNLSVCSILRLLQTCRSFHDKVSGRNFWTDLLILRYSPENEKTISKLSIRDIQIDLSRYDTGFCDENIAWHFGEMAYNYNKISRLFLDPYGHGSIFEKKFITGLLYAGHCGQLDTFMDQNNINNSRIGKLVDYMYCAIRGSSMRHINLYLPRFLKDTTALCEVIKYGLQSHSSRIVFEFFIDLAQKYGIYQKGSWERVDTFRNAVEMGYIDHFLQLFTEMKKDTRLDACMYLASRPYTDDCGALLRHMLTMDFYLQEKAIHKMYEQIFHYSHHDPWMKENRKYEVGVRYLEILLPVTKHEIVVAYANVINNQEIYQVFRPYILKFAQNEIDELLWSYCETRIMVADWLGNEAKLDLVKMASQTGINDAFIASGCHCDVLLPYVSKELREYHERLISRPKKVIEIRYT